MRNSNLYFAINKNLEDEWTLKTLKLILIVLDEGITQAVCLLEVI